jgi:hypothetical protein
MKRVKKETLEAVCDELAAHPFGDAELAELAEPKLGVITGLQDLIDEIEALRRIDLGMTAPAQGVQFGNESK